MDPFFINKIKWIVDEEEKLRDSSLEDLSGKWLKQLKQKGFSDKALADFLKVTPTEIYNLRKELGIVAVFKMVDTCGGEFEAVSPYYYTADKLYFEPLTEEDVLNIIEKEKPDGVILQFGGQTAIKLASFLDELNVPILGTKPKQIDEAEDREKFDDLMEKLDVARPKGKAVWSLEEGLSEAEKLGYPVLVRPSYVLGGQGMEITYNAVELERYLIPGFERDVKNPILIDRYLVGREIEVDAISDGESVLIPGIMEHLERAGVHSGDSISIYPPQNISDRMKEKIWIQTEKVALALKVVGMINIQFIEFEDELYIIEVNPRSSRTVPYISKVTGVPMIDLATRAMLGEKIKDMGYGTGVYKEAELVAIKVPVFSTQKLPDVEVSLGPEMRSTGEVLGVGRSFEEALYKGFVGSGMGITKRFGSILATIKPSDQAEFLPLAKEYVNQGYRFVATEGTARVLQEAGIPVQVVKKIGEGVPNMLDLIRSGLIDMVINTPTKANDVTRDGFRIRRAAIEATIPVLTSLDTARGMLDIIKDGTIDNDIEVYNLGIK